MKKPLFVLPLVAFSLILAACTSEVEVTRVVEKVVTPTPPTAPAPAEARTLTALVGAGQDTEVINSFLPPRLTIRAGDTIEWKINGDEIHTNLEYRALGRSRCWSGGW